MRLLITGGNGFLGRHVCAALRDLCVQPFICGQKNTNLQSGCARERYISCDLLDFSSVDRVLDSVRPTHILHLAWIMSPPQEYWKSQANIAWAAASSHLAKTFADLGGERFVGIGTCVEYANTATARSEFLTPTLPDTLYGKAKLAASNSIMAMSQAFGFSAAWCRPFYLLGPGEAQERLIPSACRALEKNEFFQPMSGKRILDYMDVRDTAAAITRILFDESLTGVFNIASGCGRSVESLLFELADVAGRETALIGSSPADSASLELPPVVGDVSRLYKEVGFQPQFSMRQSLVDCYNTCLAEKER